jgi:hypothetical protein
VLFLADQSMVNDNMAIMKCRMDYLPTPSLGGLWSSGLFVILIAALGAGCARSEKRGAGETSFPIGGIPAPVTPTFLSGAMAVLLTNVDGFRAHVVLESAGSANQSEMIVGELMGRSGRLLFAPQPGAPQAKYSRVEDFSYIWDVGENRGFLLSGPLQAYAPISSNTQITNVVVSSGGNSPARDKVSGYTCQKSEVKVILSDGAETVFQVWRAMDLKGMPLRITGSAGGTPLSVGFSKIRLETPPNDLFLPPSDFTKYASAEAMMHELVARQQNLKKKRGWEPPPSDEVGFRDANAPVRSRY